MGEPRCDWPVGVLGAGLLSVYVSRSELYLIDQESVTRLSWRTSLHQHRLVSDETGDERPLY